MNINELKRELSKLSGVDFFNPKYRNVFKRFLDSLEGKDEQEETKPEEAAATEKGEEQSAASKATEKLEPQETKTEKPEAEDSETKEADTEESSPEEKRTESEDEEAEAEAETDTEEEETSDDSDDSDDAEEKALERILNESKKKVKSTLDDDSNDPDEESDGDEEDEESEDEDSDEVMTEDELKAQSAASLFDELLSVKMELELVRAGIREDRIETAKRLFMPEFKASGGNVEELRQLITQYPEWVAKKRGAQGFGMPVGENADALTNEEKALKRMGIDPRG